MVRVAARHAHLSPLEANKWHRETDYAPFTTGTARPTVSSSERLTPVDMEGLAGEECVGHRE